MDIIQSLFDLEINNIHFEGLLNYHAAYLYNGLGNYISSLRCVFAAAQSFKDTMCWVRYFRTKSQEANIYMATHLYSQADAINKKLIKEAKGSLSDYDYDCVVSNATLNMIYTLNYTAALRYLQNITDRQIRNWKIIKNLIMKLFILM